VVRNKQWATLFWDAVAKRLCRVIAESLQTVVKCLPFFYIEFKEGDALLGRCGAVAKSLRRLVYEALSR
jgi:hypothetical protein